MFQTVFMFVLLITAICQIQSKWNIGLIEKPAKQLFCLPSPNPSVALFWSEGFLSYLFVPYNIIKAFYKATWWQAAI